MLLCDRTDKSVVVGILKAALERVVVDVCHGALSLYAVNAHSLELEVSHCTSCVLRKGLVDLQTDLCSLYHLAVDDVRLDDLFSQCKSHIFAPCLFRVTGESPT